MEMHQIFFRIERQVTSLGRTDRNAAEKHAEGRQCDSEYEGLCSFFQNVVEFTSQILTPAKIQNVFGLLQKLKKNS